MQPVERTLLIFDYYYQSIKFPADVMPLQKSLVEGAKLVTLHLSSIAEKISIHGTSAGIGVVFSYRRTQKHLLIKLLYKLGKFTLENPIPSVREVWIFSEITHGPAHILGSGPVLSNLK